MQAPHSENHTKQQPPAAEPGPETKKPVVAETPHEKQLQPPAAEPEPQAKPKTKKRVVRKPRKKQNYITAAVRRACVVKPSTDNPGHPVIAALIAAQAALAPHDADNDYVVGIDPGFRNLGLAVRRGQDVHLIRRVDVMADLGLHTAMRKRPGSLVTAMVTCGLLDSLLTPLLGDRSGSVINIETQPKNRLRGCKTAALSEAIAVHFSGRYHVRFVRASVTRCAAQNTVSQRKKRKRYLTNKKIVEQEGLALLDTLQVLDTDGLSQLKTGKIDDGVEALLLTMA